ncbi:hypothetical protein TSAR_012254 [Trichomalopsis sarcophagae]|uniref:Uncharacterized protein n=1 Tax=Trichomalopsis sarcophagae TaxID=543379 RepID=A0A232FA37_9HYME|nr:hypothetical protein TSAR_012254 [Trichomalopsis sarcophagae]
MIHLIALSFVFRFYSQTCVLIFVLLFSNYFKRTYNTVFKEMCVCFEVPTWLGFIESSF